MLIPLCKVHLETANEHISMKMTADDQNADVTFKVKDRAKVLKLEGKMRFEQRIIKHFEMTAAAESAVTMPG